jgi:hypothetical protein
MIRRREILVLGLTAPFVVSTSARVAAQSGDLYAAAKAKER